MNLWGGCFTKKPDEQVLEFGASLPIDIRFAQYDILGSMAYSRALAAAQLLTKSEQQLIEEGLKNIWQNFDHYAAKFTLADEDIHLNIERMLSELIGEVAQKLHTGRSRNDQVAVDLILYLRSALLDVFCLLLKVINTLLKLAESHIDTIISGYTHLQQAQPIRFAHHILAYAVMFLRDLKRLQNLWPTLNTMPLGSGALAGCGFNLDRMHLSELLGFEDITINSMDAVSNRDYINDFLYANTMISQHLSRLCEDIVIFASQEFNLIKLSDEVSTGSSMMPQKKNPYVAELIRGKSGKLYSYLLDVLITMKGLPLTYQKDLQETKEPMFNSIDTISSCLAMANLLLSNITVNDQAQHMQKKNDYLFATALANYLVTKGVPFRTAHHAVGQVIQFAQQQQLQLKQLDLITYQQFHSNFDRDLFHLLNPQACIEQSQVSGGSNRQSILNQVDQVNAQITALQVWRQEKLNDINAVAHNFGF